MLSKIGQLLSNSRRNYRIIATLAAAISISTTNCYSDNPAINPELLTEFTLRFTRYTRWPRNIEEYWIHATGFDEPQRQALATVASRTLKGKSIRITFDNEANILPTHSPEVIAFANPGALGNSELCSGNFESLYILINILDEAIESECVMLELIVDESKPVFDAHLVPAARAGISMSARMLRLARNVEDQ